jgi:hypothetical protein
LGAIVGVALAAALLTFVMTACFPFSGTGLLFAIGGMAIAIGAAILLLLICGPDWCRIFDVVAWSLKWSIALGALIAAVCFSITSFFLLLVMGMTAAAIIWGLVGNGRQVPDMLSWP